MSRHVMTFECGMNALEFQQRGNLKSGYIVLRKLAHLPTINLIIVVTDVLRYVFGMRKLERRARGRIFRSREVISSL